MEFFPILYLFHLKDGITVEGVFGLVEVLEVVGSEEDLVDLEVALQVGEGHREVGD